MTKEKIIIDSVDVSTCKHYINSTHLDYNCNKTPASTYCKNNPDCYFKQLKRKEQECEILKKKLKPKLENAHCVYFEGQTGQCRAKEFTKCNPVNCKLYTIDELSTIVDLQNRNTKLKQEYEELNKIVKAQREENNFNTFKLSETVLKNGNLYSEKEKYKQALDEIGKLAKENCLTILEIINQATIKPNIARK